MSQRALIIGFSVLVHVGLGIGLGEIEAPTVHAATAIRIAEAKKVTPPPAAESAKLEPAPPKPERKEPITRRAAAAPAPESKPQAAAQPLAAAVPDFGVSLSGGIGGDGVALPASGAAPPPAPVAHSSISAQSAQSACAEAVVKPKPKSVPQPVYTAEARAAGIEGKVRVELTVDQTGTVVSVRVLQGLGYGLDEAAVLAAKQAQFEPALQCGKPTRATFTISMRFTAS